MSMPIAVNTNGEDRIPRDLIITAERTGFSLRHIPALIICTGTIDRRTITVAFRDCLAARIWLAARPEMRRT
jgi:hypothetical protein